MRQLVYLKSFKKTKGFAFCVSPETRRMHKKKWLPWSGILEEVAWGITWTIFWYFGWQWTAFGWVTDALMDCIIAFAWAKGVKKPRILFSGSKGPSRTTFFLREVLLPYLIFGPIIFLLGLNIFIYSGLATIIGIILLIIT
jgi:hypothetical protein